ncbi:M56 family metallopeptidase [Aminipila terrae]|uniref:Peptidase M56 n=1 Tax=Aminipila terrae TaxID=2697030 RepID=A0A6P1MCR9_9FIRM|nr:M56 family metallopeptidase [Aminipila terrae]QHI71631.1 peptidase M56 [Aminipila terrae]
MNELFFSVLHMSMTASYVILFIMILRLPLKRVPKNISYALWSIAAFRLLCPFSFKSIISFIPSGADKIPQYIIQSQSPHINSNAINTVTQKAAMASAADYGVSPVQTFFNSWGWQIWVTGMVLMLIYSIFCILILKNRLKDSNHLQLNIYEAYNIKTPFVLGIVNPKIYLPAGLTEGEKRYIIEHEKTHIARLDHMVKLFAFIILSIHWFNPLVWISFLLMGTDMELSCDERVIQKMGVGVKKEYSTSLLSLATNHRIINGSPLAFGERNVKGRIKNVLNYKKPVPWIIAISIIIVCIIGAGLLADPKAEALSNIKPLGESTSNLEQSISNALLSHYKTEFNSPWYEVASEGHVTLGTEDKGGLTNVYLLEQYYEFSFENGDLTVSSGHGSNVAVLSFKKDKNGKYIYHGFKAPLTDEEYYSFIKNSFSSAALDKLNTTDREKSKSDLDSQCEAYASAYLKKIGRSADIDIYAKEKQRPAINSEVSNFLFKNYKDYPYWIGTRETVEKGTRYIYETGWKDQGKLNGIITFTKKRDNGDIIKTIKIQIQDNKILPISNT